MASSHGNRQKHESTNPIQRALIGHFHKRVAELVLARQPSEILEVGCGEAYVLAALREAGVKCPIHGVDFSETAIEHARRRVPDATFAVEDARAIAQSGRKYDMVLMLEVLEHLPDAQYMLSVLPRLAKRHVIVSVPWEPFFRGLNFMRGKHLWALGNDPEHIQHWGRREFQKLVGEHLVVKDAPIVFPWTLVSAEVRA